MERTKLHKKTLLQAPLDVLQQVIHPLRSVGLVFCQSQRFSVSAAGFLLLAQLWIAAGSVWVTLPDPLPHVLVVSK